jgi:hypothetical protein
VLDASKFCRREYFFVKSSKINPCVQLVFNMICFLSGTTDCFCLMLNVSYGSYNYIDSVAVTDGCTECNIKTQINGYVTVSFLERDESPNQ